MKSIQIMYSTQQRLLLLLTLIIFYSHNVYALSQSAFVQQFLKTSEDAMLAQENLNKNRSSYGMNSALYRTDLQLNPTYKKSVTQYIGSEVSSETKGLNLEANILQSTAFGLEASLGYAEFFDNLRPTKSTQLALSQSVLGNAFGSADRKQAGAALEELKVDELRYKQDYLRVCARAHQLYVGAWAKLQAYNVFKSSTELADRAFRVTRINYARKLVKKIDFESAQADLISLQDEMSLAEAQKNTAISELKKYVDVTTEQIEIPQSLSVIKIDFSKLSSIELIKAEHLQKSAMYEAQAQSCSALPELNLTFRVGKKEADNPALDPLDKSEENWYQFGFTSQWPILNSTYSARRREAQAKVYLAEIELRRAKKELPVRLSDQAAIVQATQKSIERSIEKVKIRQSQIREARRLLDLGRIEFEDYIRYRDLELRERLRGIQLEGEGWAELMKLAVLTGEDFNVCGQF